jgi:arylsulfatase A-like enzyme
MWLFVGLGEADPGGYQAAGKRRKWGWVRHTLLLATVALFTATLGPATASTTTLTAQADAFVVSSAPNSNRGSAIPLRINDDVKRSYFRFDVAGLPAGESVTAATLKVFTTSVAKCSQGAEVLRANDTWDESTITWNNQPGPTGSALAQVTSWTTNKYVNFDVTSAVTGSGPVSFLLRHASGCTPTGDATFHSREGTKKPQLVVQTSPAPQPQCSDGVDNDGDGQTDFPNDPGCTDAEDNDETDGQTARPNVLVIMTDDQRASSDGLSVMDDLRRVYGDGGTYYPNGVVTTALCCPSRASTFAGRYAHNTGVIANDGDPLDQSTTMQYQLQQNLGYKTALTGKYLNEFTGTPPYFDLLALRAGYYDSSGSYSTTYIKDKAVEFLRTFERTDEQPWLMFVHPFAPHEDAVPEAKYAEAFVPPWQDNPANTETDLSDKPPYVPRQAATASKSAIQSLRIRMIRTLYSVDDLIAAVFAELDALGETDTLAFFLSDNGWEWYEHQLKGKGHAYNDSHRVPFFVRWPGRIPAGKVDPRIVANIDIAPTVYDALGYRPDNYIPDGQSIFTSQRDLILIEGFGRGYRGLWDPAWMYAEYNDGFREYYGPDDPWQLDNGFRTGNPPPNAAELNSQLQSHKTCSGTACP